MNTSLFSNRMHLLCAGASLVLLCSPVQAQTVLFGDGTRVQIPEECIDPVTGRVLITEDSLEFCSDLPTAAIRAFNAQGGDGSDFTAGIGGDDNGDTGDDGGDGSDFTAGIGGDDNGDTGDDGGDTGDDGGDGGDTGDDGGDTGDDGNGNQNPGNAAPIGNAPFDGVEGEEPSSGSSN